MTSICSLVDLQGAPTSAVILRAMRDDQKSDVAGSDLFLTGPAGFACGGSTNQVRGPSICSRAEGRLVIVADARLDNYKELCARLTDHLQNTKPSDAELILAAYQTWGCEAPAHLLGDFAFVLWDAKTRRLLAARDPLGIRRLHFARIGSRLCLSTEPRQILCHPAISRELDEASVADHLCGLLDDPERTFFRRVKALRPGHRLIAERGHYKIERFWDIDPNFQIRYRDSSDYAEHLLEVLRIAVNDRLPPTQGAVIGIAMSGGLDSCSIAGLAQQQVMDDSLERSVAAASLVFDGLSSCDERPFISEMTGALGAPSISVLADRFGFLKDTPHHPDTESPFMAWESASRALFAALRKRGATHLFTGIGGDELLAGNRLAYFDRLIRGDVKAIGEVTTYARSQGISQVGTLYRCFVAPSIGHGLDHRLRSLLGKTTGPEVPPWISRGLRERSGLDRRLAASSSDSKAQLRHRAHQELYDYIVVRGSHLRVIAWFDRRARAAGLEAAHHPFLDRRLLELVLAFPPGELFGPEPSKPLLRRAMVGVLPEKVRCRPDKTQLGPFIDQQLREKEPHIVEGLLANPLVSELGLANPQVLRSTFRHYCKSSPTEGLRAVWNAITLEIWLREHANFLHIDRPSPRSQTLVA